MFCPRCKKCVKTNKSSYIKDTEKITKIRCSRCGIELAMGIDVLKKEGKM